MFSPSTEVLVGTDAPGRADAPGRPEIRASKARVRPDATIADGRPLADGLPLDGFPQRRDVSRLGVAHLGKYYAPARGGIESHVRELAAGLTERGHRVAVHAVNCGGTTSGSGRSVTLGRTRSRRFEDDGVAVTLHGRVANLMKLDVCPRLTAGANGLLVGPAGRRATLGAGLREPTDGSPDLLHLHVPNPTMMVALALSRFAGPTVVTYHSDIVRQSRAAALLRRLERRVLRRAGAILVSSAEYAEASPVLREHADRVRVVPFGIDLARFAGLDPVAEKAAEALRARHPGPLWAMVGRLVYYKGHEVAVRALRNVPGTLLIVGDGPLAERVERVAEECGVADRIAFLPNADDAAVRVALKAATALWFPSTHRSESFGIAQIEAMASGCPVINTAIPGSGVPAVSVDGVSGLTVAPGDPAALARAANRLAESPSMRNELADGARRRAFAEFDRDLMLGRVEAIYEELTAGAGRHAPR
ncbi:glycosyltransferase [Alienimonas californiensis]|uniref:D-inositol 3-phosphate glycosyltransferase n=1 Tax=Alienimonas californiensis TaxID=2527989 RepID=A0A517P7X7_9PLAN|nr:glycosyltransferase [Alienimonas californiensis]QDT15479.1 D-inositol 3-phosphate glycosyltransferase [Alienimonas californiensis]